MMFFLAAQLGEFQVFTYKQQLGAKSQNEDKCVYIFVFLTFIQMKYMEIGTQYIYLI